MGANNITQIFNVVFLCLLKAVFLALVASRVEALPMSEFFPFGSSNGDSRVPTGDYSNSGPISIAVNFPCFGNNFTKIVVYTNGLISFQNYFHSISNPVLYVYWDDVDTRNGGTIWYREETGQASLDKATKAIRLISSFYYNFNADWLFVATWDQVASSRGRDKRNTFQIVLALDSSSGMSFVLFHYNRLEWANGAPSGGDADTGTGTHWLPAQVGYYAHDHLNLYKVPGSSTPAVLNLTRTSNVDVPGRFIFKIDTAQIQLVPEPPVTSPPRTPPTILHTTPPTTQPTTRPTIPPTTPPTTPSTTPPTIPPTTPPTTHYPIMFHCETGPNAADYYIYPFDQAFYIHCVAGQAYYLEQCPAGTQWDQAQLRCQASHTRLVD